MKKLISILIGLAFIISVNAQFQNSGTVFLRTGSSFMTAPTEPPEPSPFPQILSITHTRNETDVTSHTIVMPANVNAGDLLVTFFVCDATSSTTPISIDLANSGAGWTNMFTGQSESAQFATVIWKIADSNNSLVIITNDAQKSMAQVYRITGFRTSNPINGNIVTMSRTYNSDPPALTPSFGEADYLWIVGYGADSGLSHASAAPSDFSGLTTTVATVSDSGLCTMSTAHREYRTGLSYDPGTFTSEEYETSHAFTIIINPVQ